MVQGGGTRKPWGTLGKLREHKGIILGIARLPTPLAPPPLKDILITRVCGGLVQGRHRILRRLLLLTKYQGHVSKLDMFVCFRKKHALEKISTSGLNDRAPTSAAHMGFGVVRAEIRDSN